MLRATAHQRVLLARAATGRDIIATCRSRTDEPSPAPADTHRGSPSAHDARRRRPFGRTICDICLDLAVLAEFCTDLFWTELFELMRHVGASVITRMRENEQAFAQQQDRTARIGNATSSPTGPL